MVVYFCFNHSGSFEEKNIKEFLSSANESEKNLAWTFFSFSIY